MKDEEKENSDSCNKSVESLSKTKPLTDILNTVVPEKSSSSEKESIEVPLNDQ